MDHFCEVFKIIIKPKSKNKDFKSNSQKEFNKCKHIILSFKGIDINKVDEAFCLYIIEHNKKFDC